MAFKFHQHATYEQVLAFAKDIYALTAKLPDYEHLGLINHIRLQCTDLMETTATALTSPKAADIELGLKQAIQTVVKITTNLDLAYHLKYLDSPTHQRGLMLCEDITRALHSAKDGK